MIFSKLLVFTSLLLPNLKVNDKEIEKFLLSNFPHTNVVCYSGEDVWVNGLICVNSYPIIKDKKLFLYSLQEQRWWEKDKSPKEIRRFNNKIYYYSQYTKSCH